MLQSRPNKHKAYHRANSVNARKNQRANGASVNAVLLSSVLQAGSIDYF